MSSPAYVLIMGILVAMAASWFVVASLTITEFFIDRIDAFLSDRISDRVAAFLVRTAKGSGPREPRRLRAPRDERALLTPRGPCS